MFEGGKGSTVLNDCPSKKHYQDDEVEDLLGESSIHSQEEAAVQKRLTAGTSAEEDLVKSLYSIIILCLQSNMSSLIVASL